MQRKYIIITYGCQMNIFDSNVLEAILSSMNYTKTKNIYDADFIFINGCSVREHAKQRALGFISSMKNSFKKGAKIYITGCLANSLNNYPSFINGLIGTVNYSQIPNIIDMDSFVDLRDINYENDYTNYTINNNITMYISIIKGCNNFCSYCIVPYLRGKEFSYSPSSLIKQIERSINRTTKEIFLLGQNVNSYKYKDINFEQLLSIIAKTFNNYRIRFLTSHPKDYNKDLIDIISKYDNICNSIHLPFQSGSNKILKIMHRNYTIEDYIRKIEITRSILPDVSITTDIMTGFPYETEEDFNKTLNIVKLLRFDDAFMYKYSKRDFTLAYHWDDIDEKIKLQRLNDLIILQNSIKIEKIRELMNSKQKVLIERISKKNKNDFIGRDEGNRSIVVQNKCEIGSIVNVKIIDIKGNTPIAKVEEEKCI